MQQQMRRRRMFGIAAQAGAAILAACGGGAPGTAVRQASVSSAVSATGAPTPAMATASDLLRMLAFVPGPLDRWQHTLSYANIGVVKQRYGLADIRSIDDLTTRNVSITEYGDTQGVCFLSPFTYNGISPDGEDRRVFGFDSFQVDREISAGTLPDYLDTSIARQPPDAFADMAGTFDVTASATALRDGGYTMADHHGATYFTARGDNEVDLRDVRCRLFLARRNRLAVSAARVVAAPTTAIIEGALDAEQYRIPTLAMNPTARAIAHALDDVISMVAVPPDYPDRSIRASIARSRSQQGSAQGIATSLRDLARQWGTIHAPELLAIGVTDAGNFRRALRIAFVYANPADAAADAPELVRRLTDYRPPAPLFPTTPNAVISRVVMSDGKGIFVAELAIISSPSLNSAWTHLTAEDILHSIALTDPGRTADVLTAMYPPPTRAPSGSPTR